MAADRRRDRGRSDRTAPCHRRPGPLDDNIFVDEPATRLWVETESDRESTFALDVDTGSYTVDPRWLDEGYVAPDRVGSTRGVDQRLPLRRLPRTPTRALDVTIDGGPSPFDSGNYLVRVGVRARRRGRRPWTGGELTFVVDTSGSMDRATGSDMVKRSLEILVDELEDDDTVAIVTYDDQAGVVLAPTEVAERDTILDAIDALRPGGATNLEAGLCSGYALANEAFRRDGINRVVLASDGVANAGVTDPTARRR